MRYLVLLLALVVAIPAASTSAQDVDPICWYRPHYLSQPWIAVGMSCLEEVINDPSAGELAFTALAAAPDGT
ncbi:MAG: hypothetical protein LC121_10225, partial [Anaerolineae bacterium]|nr:hypothetical protein [Anaerolineae bacterium]